MEIIINGKEAALKKKTSFEYISENSMFTGSDSYTLTITFPLKDCPQNQAIFGHIERKDVAKSKVVFDCEIRDRAFYKAGSIVVTQVSEVEVKTQFLEGRSEQNFDDTFDDIYLNQLNLGYAPADMRNPANNTPERLYAKYPAHDYVPLPWVNNSSGNIQNEVLNNGDVPTTYTWQKPTTQLTFQPYLLYILRRICSVLGYTGNFTAIENSDFKYLIICNTLPAVWGAWNFAIALPHWTLTEFFEQLELFLYGEFAINHKAKTISFRFTTEMVRNTTAVYIDKVVNKYTAEVSQEQSSDYMGVKNLAYAENDNRYWAYRSCQWYINQYGSEAKVFDTLAELNTYAQQFKISGYYVGTNGRGGTSETFLRGYPSASEGNSLFYARDVDTYFIMFCYKAELVRDAEAHDGTVYHWYKYYNRLEPINQFGPRVTVDDADEVEVKIVPAWIDDTDDEHGPCIFLNCGEMGSATSWTEETDEDGNTTGTLTNANGSFGGNRSGSGRRAPAYSRSSYFGGARGNDYLDDEEYNDGALAQGKAGRVIAKGETEKADAYFDCIYMAFWSNYELWQGLSPCPTIDKVMTNNNFQFIDSTYSLRLNAVSTHIDRTAMHSIDGKKKYTFSFLADEIPDPHAVFYIEGARYICEKITATFHESTGKSQLLKGVFYRVSG